MKSVAKRIESRMRLTPDEVFFPSDFFDIDEPLRVNKVLSRMVQNEEAWRLTRGMYAIFSVNEYGKALAYTGSLAMSYARKTGIIITEIGAAAANVLGFSTQNVMKEIYLTSGKPMTWLLRARTVEFRQGTKSEMLFGSALEGRLVRAWQYMGEDEAFAALPLLNKGMAIRVNWDAIINADGMLPAWMPRLARKCKLTKWS